MRRSHSPGKIKRHDGDDEEERYGGDSGEGGEGVRTWMEANQKRVELDN